MANDRNYFNSYEDAEIHKIMLEDVTRNLAYKKAMLDNADYFANKIVMDVGCGTGILSVYAAQAGAKKVYAIEATNLADLAREIAKENGFENVIEVTQCKIEDFAMPADNEQVDIIISEWMGFYLLHEGMLDSVLFARDKFLKPDGELFPSSAVIYIAPCSLPEEFNKDWSDVQGVKMKCFGKHLRKAMSHKPDIATINPEDILGIETPFCWINLKEDKPDELNSFTLKHVFGATKKGNFQAICLWFDCIFPDINKEKPKVILETSPFTSETHWKQTVLILPADQEVSKGEPIALQLDINRDANNKRSYIIQLAMLNPDNVEHPLPCSCHLTRCIVTKTFMDENPVVNGQVSSTTNDSETQTT